MFNIAKLPFLCLTLALTACSTEENTPTTATVPASAPESSASTAAVATPELGDFGIDLSYRDFSIKPGDDFFHYANGIWLDTYELPADRSRHGSFNVLVDRSDERVRTVIDDLTDMEPPQGSIEQKISDYYLSFMNTEVLDARGITPLRPGLTRLSDIDTLDELVTAFGRSRIDTTISPFNFGIGPDRSNPDANQLSIAVGGIGLPDRDYYLLDTEQFANVRREYVAHIARLLAFAGLEDTSAKAEAILALETKIAEQLWPRADRRNRDLTYNPMEYADFVTAYPGFDWNLYFSAAGIEQLDDLNVTYPSAMSPIIELVSSVPVDDWKSYLAYHLISNNASILSEEIDQENFHFYSTVLNRVPEQRERWERAVQRLGALESLGEAIGQVYVERHFPQSAKQMMEGLVENLRTSLAQSIAQLDWM